MENMLILCEHCHKHFDSFNGRLWRRSLGTINIDQAVQLLQSDRLKETPPILKMQIERFALALKCGSLRTLFKVLRKAIIFHKKGDEKKARLFLGHVKRNWRFIYKGTFLPEEVKEKIESLLQGIYRLDSIDEMERTEQEIRDTITRALAQNVTPEVFSKFKEALLKQDKALSAI
jgi:hypothetical protein